MPGPAPLVAVVLDPAPAIQAAWRADPARRAGPLAVLDSGGRIGAVCPRARAAGVAPGGSVAQALLRCPALALVPDDPEGAALVYEALLTLASSHAPLVEATNPAGGTITIGAGGLALSWGADPNKWDARPLARALLDGARDAGWRARVGVGPTRTLATLAARLGSPPPPSGTDQGNAGETGPGILWGDGAAQALHDLPLADPLLGLTPRAVEILAEAGLTTAGALAGVPPAALALRIGPDAAARVQHSLAPDDPVPLVPWSPPETIEAAVHLDDPVADGTVLAALLERLAGDLHARLTARGRAAATLVLHVATDDPGRPAQVRRSRHEPPLAGGGVLTRAIAALFAPVTLTPAAGVQEMTVVASDLRVPPVVQHDLEDTAGRGRRATRLAAVGDAVAHVARDAKNAPPGTAGDGPRTRARVALARWREDPTAAEGWRREEVTAEGWADPNAPRLPRETRPRS